MSLGRCLNTHPNGLVFKHLPRDPANVNGCKNMCDPYILISWSSLLQILVLIVFAFDDKNILFNHELNF